MPNKKLVDTILGLLVVQFILGMLANLYATLPEQKVYEVFHQLGFITLHAVNGTLLLVLGIILLVKSRKTRAFKPATGGLGNMVLAYIFGELFVFTQRDIYSLLMALTFIGALLSYARLAFSNQAR
ncbi:MAG: hypothetical protein JWS12_518 [Candidatus Saccharibacteria bacterium]|nr:hypothetical protein [Candidatus Saccharibacteria bacterium]